MHLPECEDNVLNTFILYELGKGEKSFWKPMFDIWPTDTDILINWQVDELQWLQDNDLECKAKSQRLDFLTSWNNLYSCLSQYSDHFSE
jgi:hypothetical protein